MRISDWSSDVCSSDLCTAASSGSSTAGRERIMSSSKKVNFSPSMLTNSGSSGMLYLRCAGSLPMLSASSRLSYHSRSEEHTSELQSLMRNSYAVFCLKKKKKTLG